MSEIEVWKDVPGYEGYYQASNKGRIRSIDRWVYTENPYSGPNSRVVKGRVLKSTERRPDSRYLVVSLSKHDIKRSVVVHRLVALTFLPKPDGKQCINHKDFDVTNNSIENLEWVTLKENTQHSMRAGRIKQRAGRFVKLEE